MCAQCGLGYPPSIGLDSFQEADVLGISRPCTKWNFAVRDIAELPRRINQAFEIATSGRPGPVLIELPKDITAGILQQPIPQSDVFPPDMAIQHSRREESITTIKRAAKLINIVQRSVLYVGQGIIVSPEGPKLLKELADKASIPVTTSLQGLGAFDEKDPKALHMLGLHGSGYAKKAIQEADLIIALGARFDDRVTGHVPKFAPKARKAVEEERGGIIYFDISPKNINKVVDVTEAVVGDCTDNLQLLMPFIDRTERPDWLAQVAEWKTHFAFSAYPQGEAYGLVQPQAFIERLSELVDPVKDRTIITTGVGQHQMWTAQHFRWQYPRTIITSGGLGTMGDGLPAAIGAKLARPDALVIDIDGDASFNMTLNELLTASQFNIDVKTIVLNNEEQGMVTHLQSVYYNYRFFHSHHRNLDFVEAARAMGVQAERCSNTTETDEKLKWLLEIDGPALLEAMITQKAISLPMVPAGRGLDEFLFHDQEAPPPGK
ncbi:uncharacterized protein ASPGLDRAFT_1516097 [Aspergillus glaucus CBS 516.65]|uniref:acetolactate synthase n=1 Tax=Aspergillus glaucus CBS 516.65 TaxID=1160497 RepID=A0A1L9VKM1_ASPGL|nr:hypothetical protein ASPGLDRAFT_1516097 [Aspergillus glaucus CBS 516.65]OJJ84478.1 hypothetical protein ASPGLDRAFT_1516097 [Aspergillus glaucus CBS 516.65]